MTTSNARRTSQVPPTWLPWVVLAMLFCLQFGGYTTFSVNFAAFVLTAMVLGMGHLLQGALWAALCAPFMLAALFPFLSEPGAMSAFLRTGRELVVIAVIVAATKVGRRSSINRKLVDRCLNIGIMVLFAYTAVQWYYLTILGQPRFFIDLGFYGNVGGNIHEGGEIGTAVPSALIKEMNEKGFVLGRDIQIRPTAFYSEPSYLGMVLLVLIYALTCGREWKARFIVPIALALATTVMAATASGTLSIAIFLVVNFRREIFKRWMATLLIALPVGIYLLWGPLERVMLGIDGGSDEISGYIRLVKPFQNIVEVFQAGYVFGVPFHFAETILKPSEFGEGVGSSGGIGLDTGILNLLIFNGIGGLVVFGILAWLLRPIELLFVVLMGVSNGVVFGYDKGFLIALAIAYVRARERKAVA